MVFGFNFQHGLLSDVHTPHHWGEIVIEGNDAEKPVAGTAGRLFWATDTHIFYKDNGVAWVEIWRDAGTLLGYDYTNTIHRDIAVDPVTKALLFKGLGGGEGNGNGVTDHGELTGLDDDDHAQYFNSARHTLTVHDTLGLLKKAGGVMTGPLTLFGAPTSDLHASTKKYVDDNIGGGIGTAFARVYTLTAQVITKRSLVKINWTHESYDPGGNFNLSTDRFDIPVSGYYHILGQSSWEDEYIERDKIGIFETTVFRNGAYFLTSNECAPTRGPEKGMDVNPIVNDIRHCDEGDYLELKVAAWQDIDGRLRANIDADCFFTIWLVKPD